MFGPVPAPYRFDSGGFCSGSDICVPSSAFEGHASRASDADGIADRGCGHLSVHDAAIPVRGIVIPVYDCAVRFLTIARLGHIFAR